MRPSVDSSKITAGYQVSKVKMPHYYCCAVKCNSGTKKKLNLVKYPWMKDIDLHPFPHKTQEKSLRKQWINMVRRKELDSSTKWEPRREMRVCSIHFIGLKGPTDEVKVPTLFDYNNYGGLLNPSRNSRARRHVPDRHSSLFFAKFHKNCFPVLRASYAPVL